MLPTNDALLFAFNQLSATVIDLSRRRGQCLGAPLKLELRRRSSGTFNERSLGFLRFGDFLRAAELAGHIRIHPTHGGDVLVTSTSTEATPDPNQLLGDLTTPTVPDVQHELTGSPSPPPAPRHIHFVPLSRVRQDLWNGFNSVYDEWIYDRSQDLAMRKNALGRSENPSDLIPIPSGRQSLREWIQAFADKQTTEQRQLIIGLLERQNAPLNFLSEVRRDRYLHRSWHRFHVQSVLEKIQQWATTNGVQPTIVATMSRERPFRSTGANVLSPVASQLSGANSGDNQKSSSVASLEQPKGTSHHLLSERLGQAIDDMIDRLIMLRGLIATVNRQS